MPPRNKAPLASPGDVCVSDLRGVPHTIEGPSADVDLQTVYRWLRARPIDRLLTVAVDDAVQYVLDGARTWRFDLNSPEVDSDERASVGTKLQYRIISGLELLKEPPLDTRIAGIAVELKGTVRSTWMIPREGQCELCLLVQVDTGRDRFRAFLLRTHRMWLNAPNQDKKRSVKAGARDTYALPLVPWTPLPISPLKSLSPQQLAVVFDLHDGQATRLTALFGFMPNVVIPRIAILTVCANRADPMRRAREIKQRVLDEHGLRLLCGTWQADRQEAEARGYDISDEAWIALSPASGHSGQDLPSNRLRKTGGDGVPDLLSDLGLGPNP